MINTIRHLDESVGEDDMRVDEVEAQESCGNSEGRELYRHVDD